MGLWGASIPEELGGVGLSTLGNCLLEEELAQTIIPFNLGDVSPILFDCNDRQMESYFLPALNKQKQPYLALMEPDRGTEVSTMEMRAEKANDYYLLNGSKVSLSRAGKDYFAVVFATTDNGDGTTCFLVDKDIPGFSVIEGEKKTGWQSQVMEPLRLVFNHCRMPAENILGEEGKAFHLGKKWLPSRRVMRSARCVGVTQRLLEEATTRAQSWQTFGKPISGQASIQAALSDIAVAIHACRLMVYEAAWKADKGAPIRREAAMAKLFATQMVHNAADRVAHIYGGPPHVAGLPMERLCRHALATSATELALELQRSIIANDILSGLKV
jgi:alkylation response protein AidB-like acyl-CoA dehydrogenase